MGGFATHAIFGKEVLEEISDEMLASVIRKHPGIFGIGCQGPDLFLYNIPMLLQKHKLIIYLLYFYNIYYKSFFFYTKELLKKPLIFSGFCFILLYYI